MWLFACTENELKLICVKKTWSTWPKRSRKKTRRPRHIYSMVICVFIQNLKGKKTVLLASYVLHIQAHKNVPEQQSFTVDASGEMILLCEDLQRENSFYWLRLLQFQRETADRILFFCLNRLLALKSGKKSRHHIKKLEKKKKIKQRFKNYLFLLFIFELVKDPNCYNCSAEKQQSKHCNTKTQWTKQNFQIRDLSIAFITVKSLRLKRL